jgi:hypothetical protein
MTGWYYACVRIQVQFAATFSSEVENENYLLNYIYMLSYQIFILADEVNEKKIFFKKTGDTIAGKKSLP